MINFLFTALFFFTPLVFNLANSEFFEVPKMYFVYILTVFIVTTHLYNYIRGRAPLFRPHRLNLPISVFYISQAVSTFFSIDTHTSIFGYYSRLNGGLLSLTSYTLLYFVLSVYVNDKLKNKIISASLLSGLFITIYGILEHFGIDKHFWVQDVQARVFSTLGQPNWLAAYLCILLPFALDRFLSSSRLIHKSYFTLLTSIFYICLLFTKSKSGIIAAIITMSLFILIKIFQKSNRLILVSSFLFLVSLSLIISNPIKDKFFKPPISNSSLVISNLNITPSEDIRKIVWQGSIALWKQFPLFGTGPETFAYTYYWTRPASHNLTSEWNFIYNKAHNEYLNYLATTGAFGFLSYLLLIIVTSFYVLRLSFYDKKLAIFTSFLSILITNFFGFSVVITSLYLFLLPVLIFEPLPLRSHQSKHFIFILILVSSFLFLVSKLFSYSLADIAFARPTVDNLQSAIRTRPDEAIYLSKYANVLAEKSIPTKDKTHIFAITNSLNQVVLLSPFNLNLWKDRAQTFYYLAQIDSQYYKYALDALTKATRLAPTDASSFYLLGVFYQNISDDDSALQNYQKAIDLKPNYDHATFALGELYLRQKKYDLARPLFEKTLQIAPGNTDAKKYLDSINEK